MTNWLLISIGILFLVCIIIGYVRGILRIGVSLLATIASIVLVLILTPYVSTAIEKWSPIKDMVETKCVKVFAEMVPVESLQGLDLSGTALEDVDTAELADVNLSKAGLSMADLTKIMGELTKDAQISAIEKAGFPAFLQNALLANNNTEVYKELGVTSFPQYIASYISKILIHIIAFLITFLLVTIIVRALIVAVDIISDLPVLGLITRVTGAVAGAGMALIVVWIFFVIITAAGATQIGKECFAQIGQSAVLQLLYENNYILKFLMSF
ncbi:MAG: CvpA family protein [Hespellia sp.]|nr:CvpA family protein [Hespellia sp.]